MIKNKFMYILLLVIIIVLLITMNYSTLVSIQENFFDFGSATAPQPAEDQSQAVTENRAITSNISTSTYNSKLTGVVNQINECQSLIDQINTMVPRSIENIQVGTVSQTDDLDEVGVNIQTSSTLELDPITNKSAPSSKWTIDWILPRGQPGQEGLQGPKGETGPRGDFGPDGKQGLQGPWGKDCDKC